MTTQTTDRIEPAQNGGTLTYRQKHAQANREALATVAALVATIVVWVVLGFGLSGLDVELFHTPLWVIGGTVGTWVFSIIVVIVLGRRVFKNFDLDDVDATSGAVANSADGAPASAAPSARIEQAGEPRE